jgi:maltooligosyltrehalose synthase
MQAYALKAAREGKQETSWLNPHTAYEAGLTNIHRADTGSLGFGGISRFA